MKTANAILTVTKTKDKAIFEISIKRTSKETYLMGNSSLLINFDKYSFANPKLTYANPMYSTGPYDPLEMAVIWRRVLALQVRINAMPIVQVPTANEIFATVEFDLIGNSQNVGWRSIDTAIVTPDFQEVITNYSLIFSEENINRKKK